MKKCSEFLNTTNLYYYHEMGGEYYIGHPHLQETQNFLKPYKYEFIKFNIPPFVPPVLFGVKKWTIFYKNSFSMSAAICA